MTTRDFCLKWLVYAIALLPVWLLGAYLLNRFPVLGAVPTLLPLCAVVVAVLEGASGGAGFGLAVGVLYQAVTPDAGAFYILVFALLGLGAGLLSQYVLRQDLLGCAISCLLALLILDGGRIFFRLITGKAALLSLLRVAGAEILWSMVFVIPIYLLFRWVCSIVPKATVL